MYKFFWSWKAKCNWTIHWELACAKISRSSQKNAESDRFICESKKIPLDRNSKTQTPKYKPFQIYWGFSWHKLSASTHAWLNALRRRPLVRWFWSGRSHPCVFAVYKLSERPSHLQWIDNVRIFLMKEGFVRLEFHEQMISQCKFSCWLFEFRNPLDKTLSLPSLKAIQDLYLKVFVSPENAAIKRKIWRCYIEESNARSGLRIAKHFVHAPLKGGQKVEFIFPAHFFNQNCWNSLYR